MTPEQRERKREYERKRRANMTPEQRERKREYQRAWKRERRANMTPEQGKLRREQRHKWWTNTTPELISRRMCSAAKNRARRRGIPFGITWRDITVPDICPVRRTPLRCGQGIFCDDSPSLDRIVPELGYIKGNVVVVSWRVNRLRSNATIDDLEIVLKYARFLRRLT